MTTAAPPKPLEVQLPVCPVCEQVSSLPAPAFGGKTFCTGPMEAPHKRVRRQPRKFVEAGE